MAQNMSHAVMAQRHEAHDSLDFFPTPPWATRALCEEVLWPQIDIDLRDMDVLEPACGGGDMARPLAEYFRSVRATDCHDYGYGEQHDFLMPYLPSPRPYYPSSPPHWIVTNPPFRLGEQFIRRALDIASHGVAMLVRTAFLESRERHKIFSEMPPAIVAQFVERVPMVKGRLDAKASSATAYCWIVWMQGQHDTRMRWIPPCRKHLERDGDYPDIND